MSNRFNNRNLFLILGGLSVILLITFVVKIPSKRSTIKERLLDIDTSAVARIEITPKAAEGKSFEFIKQDNRWVVKQGDIISEPRNGAVRNIFNEALSIKPQSLAAVDKSMWEEYELTDSLATRIKFLNKKNQKMADLMVGKFVYKQVVNPYSYGGNDIEGTSFVRLYNDKEIYAVNGFLTFSFGGGFDDWRDKSFIRCNKNDILKISFTYPSDSSYTLIKKDSVWVAGSHPADSLKTQNYLNSIGSVNGEDFMDGYKPVSLPAYMMNIEGNNMLNISVKCYLDQEKDQYVFNSSQNPEIYFASTKSGLYDKLFKPSGYFNKK
jgi:hypothetical protein